MTASSPAQPPPDEAPYPGLDPYTASKADFFCGRDGEVRIVGANALTHRVTLFYGESGVGKTSVLRAGVMKDLRDRAKADFAAGTLQFIPAYLDQWHAEPAAALLGAVATEVAAITGSELSPQIPDEDFGQTLRRWSDEMKTDFVLLLDQFEELFLYHTPAHDAFCNEFAQMLSPRRGCVNVLISIREDSLARLDAFKDRIPGLFANRVRIEHLSRTGAEEAITKPLEIFKLANGGEVGIERELVSALLDEPELRAGRLFTESTQIASQTRDDERYETSLLQIVLTRLWQEEIGGADGTEAPTLRLSTYLDRLGGARKIINRHLDHALDQLPAPDQQLFAEASRLLVTRSRQKYAWNVSDLALELKTATDSLERLLHGLAQRPYRVLRGAAAQGSYQIFHDVLAEPLLAWRARHDAAQEHKRAEDEASRKLEHERNATEKRFADERAKAEQRWQAEKLRRLKWGLITLGFLLCVLAAIAYEAWQQKQNAYNAQKNALDANQQLTSINAELTQKTVELSNRKEEAELQKSRAEAALKQSLEAMQERLDAARTASEGQKIVVEASREVVGQVSELRSRISPRLSPKDAASLAKTLDNLEQVLTTAVTAETVTTALAAASENLTQVIAAPEKPVGDPGNPPNFPEKWAYYGLQDSRGDWSSRYFKQHDGNPSAVPKPGDIVVAIAEVNIRGDVIRFKENEWVNGPIRGLLRKGRSVHVAEVTGPDREQNSPFTWIRFDTLDR